MSRFPLSRGTRVRVYWKMPKRTGGRRARGQKRPPRDNQRTGVISRMAEADRKEDESEGELGEEELQGLGLEDMEMISRMGLDKDEPHKKRCRKESSALSTDSLEEGFPSEGAGGRRKRRREVGGDEGEDGASWEGVRSGGVGENEEEVHYLLPLKSGGKLVLQSPVPRSNGPGGGGLDSEAEEQDKEGGMDGEMEAEESVAPSPSKLQVERLSTAALLARREATLEQRKAAIADLASSLVEAPEDNISSVQRLLVFCCEREAQVACTVRRFAMASLAAIFRDIAPSYHIRELTEEEKATKVSKDVRKLRAFEETLRSSYQHYLSLLNDYVEAGLGEGRRGRGKGNKKRPLEALEDGLTLSRTSMQDLGEVALRCLCELLVGLPHFNFRNNILAVVVPRMTSKTLAGKVAQLCCETVEKLFGEDLVGDVSLECVRLICKMIKSKSYNMRPAVLRSFLQLSLYSVDGPVGGGGGVGAGNKKQRGREGPVPTGKGSQLTRKQRKRLKAERELDRDLREAEATESQEKKTKLQTEVLQLVFATYFRVLKNSRHSPLLQPVLEGLAKFSHLISVDFFSDLMSVLHSLAETGGLTNKECMLCVLTAFEILSGQGESLNIDPRQFYVQLYGALLQLDSVSSNQDIVLALGCMDKMMRKRRQVSLQRVLGFVKRLSTVSLQLMPGACLAVLSTVRKCMLTYSQCDQLLDADGVCGGVFRPEVPDPEVSQAGSTLLWEITVFSHHYSPAVRGYASHLLHGAPTQGRCALHPDLAKRTAEELVASQSVPLPPFPPPHPAIKLALKNKEHFYGDAGIRDDVIRKAEQEAIQLANVDSFDVRLTS